MSVAAISEAKAKLVRWHYILYGMILFLFMGVVYAWSLFAGPLEAQYQWTRAETSLVFTICMSFYGIGNIIGGFFANKRPLRFNVGISAVCMLIGFVASSYVSEIWQLYITYGVFIGFAVGFSYGPTISAVVKWFPDKAGFASGALLVAFGLSTMIIGTPVAHLFRIIGISKSFLIMGIVFSVGMSLVVLLIKTPPADTVFPPPKTKAGLAASAVADMKTSEVLRRPSLWLFLLWQTGMCTSGWAIIGQAATSASSIGASLALATVATSGLSVANGLSRVVWGALCDMLGIVKLKWIVSLVMLAGFGVCIGALFLENPILLTAGFFVIGIAYGGTVAYVPPFFRGMYGTSYYASNYGLYFIASIPCTVIGPTIISLVYASSGSYLSAYSAVLGVLVAGILCLFGLRKP